MSLEDYKIADIEDIKFYGKRLIKKNIPDSIEVTEHEFNTFIKNRSLRYEHIRQRDFPDTIEYYDKYDNNVAGRTVDKGKSYTFYFINPELYDKGKQEKCKIVDVYSDTEEEVLSLDNAAPTLISEEVIIT